MSRYTITPWRQPSSLLQVRQALYHSDASDPDSRRSAIDLIMSWKLRGNLPHAVESTALLLDATLHHQSSMQLSSTASSTAVVSDFSVRATYSAAFCRFVTGFCDIGRHKERSLEPSSMLEIARQIAMPEPFVALRHEATHEELPSVRRLASATREGLQWLWMVYWAKLDEGKGVGDGEDGVERVREEGSRFLREFRRRRRDALKKGKVKAGDEFVGVCDACVEMCGSSEAKIQALTAVMVQERLLMPSNRLLGASLDGAYLIWDQLLDDLSTRIPNFRSALVQSCLQELTEHTATSPSNDVEREALVLWILHLIESEEQLASQAMKWCCLYSSQWTAKLGQELLESENEYAEDWRDLFGASIGTSDTTSAKADGATSTDTDMVEVESEAEAEQGGWTRAILPSRTPIGVCG